MFLEYGPKQQLPVAHCFFELWVIASCFISQAVPSHEDSKTTVSNLKISPKQVHDTHTILEYKTPSLFKMLINFTNYNSYILLNVNSAQK